MISNFLYRYSMKKFNRFKAKATEIGRLIKDQPMSGLEKVVWWTEYVIRNKGASFLRNPRVDVSWTELLILDVVLFLFAILFTSLFIFYKIISYLSSLVLQKTQSKIKTG